MRSLPRAFSAVKKRANCNERVVIAPVVTAVLLLASTAPAVQNMSSIIARIDRETPGTLGVHILDVRSGEEASYQADRPWYLASVTKILVAICVLQKDDAGELSLNDEIPLDSSRFVDGSGSLRFMKPGTPLTIRFLLEQMISKSDSTAADTLIAMLGESGLNDQARKISPQGLGPFTSLLQVRYDVYSLLHPRAIELSNRQIVELKGIANRAQRMKRFMAILGLKPNELHAPTLDAAYEQYYKSGKNTGTLTAMSSVLERLWKGELLSANNTDFLIGLMDQIETGGGRIAAGLSSDLHFAQKTGTQVSRICNVGILRKSKPQGAPLIAVDKVLTVSACVEGFKKQKDAERALQALGEAISEIWLGNKKTGPLEENDPAR